MVLLGSTGSIGMQALDVVRRNRDRFRVVALAADGSRVEELARQAVEFDVGTVAVARADAEQPLRDALAGAGAPDLPVLVGPDAATRLAEADCDVVLNGITGAVGLRPTLAALRARARRSRWRTRSP